MNKWKVAFFTLLILIVLFIIGIYLWATSPSEEVSAPTMENSQKETDSVLLVETTTKDFEKVVNKLLKEELDTNSLPFQLNVTSQIELISELQIFGITVPISMYFDPEVKEDGNIRLKQTAVNVGKFNLPSETVLKLMNDSIPLPKWMIVRPNSNEIDIDLSQIKIMGGAKVRAKQFDLEKDKVILEVIVTNE